MSGIDSPMNYELLRDSIETLLNYYAPTRFRVVTEQKQSSGADEHKGILRSIQIFYESGEYPDQSSNGREVDHQASFQIEYTSTSAAKADLSVLNDDTATAAEYTAALSAAQTASYLANRSIDELRRMVSQIILDPVNIKNCLGLGRTSTGGSKIGDVRLLNFRKNQGIPRGKLFELTASEQLRVDIPESFTGATPKAPATDTYDIEHQFKTKTDPDGADPAITGVETDAT